MEEDPGARFERIQQREEEIRQREKKLRKQYHIKVDEEKPRNFPPFCPFMHHDISELPIVAQWTLRIHFIGMFVYFVALIWNFVAACTTGSIKAEKYSLGSNIVFSIIIGILGIPCAFKLNYMKLYAQAEHNNVKMTFFALQALFVAGIALVFAGLVNSGCMGIITTIDAISTGSGFAKGAIPFATALWGLVLAWQVFMFGKAMTLFKATGTGSSGRVLEATKVEEAEEA